MENLDYSHEVKKINTTKKLQEFFAAFIVLTKSVLEKYNNETTPEYHKIIYQNLLQRIYIGICAIDTLLDKYKKNKYFKHPIAIQMRSSILDSITIVYLLLFIDKNNPVKFKDQITKLNHPVARELNEEIEEMIRNGKQDYKIYFDHASSLFPDNFTKDQRIKLKKIQELNPKTMVKALKGSPFEYYSKIYKLYTHYSKYEHYGTISKRLLEYRAEFEFDKLTYSTYFVFQASYLAMQVMEVNKSEIEMMKHLRDRIIEMEPTDTIKKSTTASSA